jgi:uncharacterized protein DUF6152
MKQVLCAAVFIASVAGTSTSAHHSWAAFDRTQVIEIDGVLEESTWATPHSLLKVRTAQRMYTIEGPAPNALRRRGLTGDMLKAGDRIIVGGNPRRDIAESGVMSLESVRRLSDGWSWPAVYPTAAPLDSKR